MWEIAFVAVGIGLRLLNLVTYPVSAGYDFHEHWPHIEWWKTHFELAPLQLCRTAYHPPLYYALCGLIRRLGGDSSSIQAFSVLAGCLRLLLVWLACERYLPGRRLARCTALALAAVMPASVHLDGMASQEALANLLSVAGLLLILEMLRRRNGNRWGWALGLGMVAGMAALTKISAFVLVASVILAAGLELVLARAVPAQQRVLRLAPWMVSLALTIAVSGWYYVNNHRAHGKAVLNGWYQRPTEDIQRVSAHRLPVLDRRTLGFYVGWSPRLWNFPYYTADPSPRLWSLLVGSTFVDYFNYGFAPAGGAAGSVLANGKTLSERAFKLSRASAVGGTLIAAVTVASWVIVAAMMIVRGSTVRLAALGFSGLAFLGQLRFATEFPYDFEGVVKGIYLHFGSLPLYALFATAVAWLWTRRWSRPLAVAAWIAVGTVGTYTIYCRLP